MTTTVTFRLPDAEEWIDGPPLPRLDYAAAAPDAVGAMLRLERWVRGCGLEPSLLHLMKLRASQLNGCAYCVDMHSRDARLAGESEQRLYAVAVWAETPFFTRRERLALAWTERVTRLGDGGVPDGLYAQALEEFDEAGLVQLTMAVIAINGWNRLSVTFRAQAGSHEPGSHA